MVLVAIAAFFGIYQRIVPCKDGFTIGECGFSTRYFYVIMVLCAMTYSSVAGLYKLWKMKKGQSTKLSTYLLIGSISLIIIVFGPFSNIWILQYISFPFMYISAIATMGSWEVLW